MARVHKEKFEINMDYVNLPDAAPSPKTQSTTVIPPKPGGKRYRLVGVSFGLLCVLQAALNISLRLTLGCAPSDRSHNKSSDTEASCKPPSEEAAELKRKLNAINHYAQQEWVYFHPSLYYISSIKKSWQDSRDDCVQRGADLVIINSEMEQNFTNKFQKPVWIGLSYRQKRKIWVWVDGTRLTKSYWHTGEPNNFCDREEDCVEIRFEYTDDNWNDIVCAEENFWICEKPVAL